jgi:hypothetical protein
MIDLNEFGRQFTDRLLTLAAEGRGVGRIEAVRKYHTDPTFKAMVDTIVQTAMQTITEQERAGHDGPLAYEKSIFNQEASDLLGWTEP